MSEHVNDDDSLANLQTRLGYAFKDQDLLVQALTHSSFSPINNERLEFLGDAVLKFVLSHFLFKRMREAGEGILTRERASMETNAQLAHVAENLKVAPLIRLGKGARKDGIVKNEGLLAGVVESIVAAIYIDGCLDDVVDMIRRHIDPQEHLSDRSRQGALDDRPAPLHPKTELQEFTIKRFGVYPLYRSGRIDADNSLRWGVHCTIPNTELETHGESVNIQAAETIAAQKMLAIVLQR